MRIVDRSEKAFNSADSSRGQALEALTAQVRRLPAVLKSDLKSGDWVVITTQNSVYSLYVLDPGTYAVAGGWFDRHEAAPQHVQVNGCTFGGRAIKTDIVAAPGLFLEFSNRVTTTRIREAWVVRGDDRPPYH